MPKAQPDKPFRFQDMQIYASTEWMVNNRKKYRQVFDLHKTSYVYAELSLVNKLFDQEDWELQIDLRCYEVTDAERRQICDLSFNKKISRFEHLVYIREGWGSKQAGMYWKRGTYLWEAWLDGTLVDSKYFYIEDSELNMDADTDARSFLELESVRLYEGPYEDVPRHQRSYYQTFKADETRYIYADLVFRNVHPADTWQSEVFIKFFTEARDLKGQIVRLNRVSKEDNQIHITAGWGSNTPKSWRKGRYYMEVSFMEELLAVLTFDVEDYFEDGVGKLWLPEESDAVNKTEVVDPDTTFEEVMGKLDGLIGLTAIKKQVRDHARYIQFLQLRQQRGFTENDQINVHSVFIGNPGTGKTTVAGMMGRLYKKMGILSRGHVVEVSRVDLVGEYIGQTAPKVRDVIKKARGGVLFIDEAYSLMRSKEDSKDFGREAVEVLIREMSDGEGDLTVIAAGYPKEMKHFLEYNPGLKSRFKLHFEFDDYLPQELYQIVGYVCTELDVVLSEKAEARIREIIVDAYRDRDRTFGNARFVHNLIEKAKIQLGLRVMTSEDTAALTDTQLRHITVEDVNASQLAGKRELPAIPVDEKLLAASLDELNRMIGLTKVKAQIREMVRLVRYYHETERDVLNGFFLHTVFVGNPGTGKTTVARILTKIYKALGMLERGHMVETDRQGLVAGYVGQTSTKTAERVDEAMGGVLFIDEAYALTQNTNSARGDFGDEAIQTLLKRMEDKRGRFFVFVAGYPDNMESFLKANPGLNSRFDKILKFEDYSPAELFQIALTMLRQEGLIPAPEAETYLRKYFKATHVYRDKYFGNARAVRSLVTEAIKNQNLRLSELTPAEREETSTNVVTLEDVQSFGTKKGDEVFNKKRIGFRRERPGS